MFSVTKIEYLMVYTHGGLPIYSKCFGHFCQTAFKNPELLTGLLSALESIPPTLGDGLSLEAVKMGYTTMRFSKVMPGGQSVVIGLSEDDLATAEAVFNGVKQLFELDKFKDVDWGYVRRDIVDAFTQELVDRVLVDVMHERGGFHDECPLGDMCPMHTRADTADSRGIWSIIRSKYDELRRRMRAKMGE